MRRGFTLLELVWGVVLGLILATLLSRLLVSSAKHLRHQRARAEAQSTARGAVDYLAAELANAGWGAGESDILDAAPGRIRLRARRGLALACWTAPAGTILLRAGLGYGRPPAAGRDSVAVFLEHDSTTRADDAWLRLPVSASPTAGAWCPDGDSALSLSTIPDPRLAVGVGVFPDAPVVSWEVVKMRSYSSGGEVWLGEQSLTGGGVIEPAFGPLAPAGYGLTLGGVAGAPISSLHDAAVVVVSVRASARSPGGFGIPPGSGLRDSLAATVTLRNTTAGWGSW